MKMTMKRSLTILFFTAASLALPLSAQAAFKCWTNKDGVRECGNAVPPEYAQKQSETINERGITVDVQERAKTKEELEQARKQEEEEKRLQEEEEKRRKQQEAYDRVLLSTFLSEKEILESRDRKIASIDASIELTRITIDKLNKDLKRERKRAANLERKGKKIPDGMQSDIDSLQRQIDNKQSYIKSKEQEKDELRQKYAKDMERFRELKADGKRLR
jgi:hypothetical protein